MKIIFVCLFPLAFFAYGSRQFARGDSRLGALCFISALGLTFVMVVALIAN